MATETFANALRRMGGMWGSVWDDSGSLLTDVVRVTATEALNRIEIPLVGQQVTGYKPGRRTHEATLAFQKVDTGWELQVYQALTMDVTALRAARDAGQFGELDGTFNLKLSQDDPHAFGKEVWQLVGCQLWQLELTVDTTADFLQAEYPMTYAEAIPLRTFRVQKGQVVRVHQLQ
jgi:hypothetical protein